MDVPIISTFFFALFYDVFFLSHNYQHARNMWTELWRIVMSFGPRIQQVFPLVFNEQTKLALYIACWMLGSHSYKHYHHQAYLSLGGNLFWSLYAFQLAVGLVFLLPQWIAMRFSYPIVNLSSENRKELSPVGFWIFVSHALPAIFMCFFGDRGHRDYFDCSHFLRAMEPMFTAATAYVLGNIEHPMGVYYRLKPLFLIMIGVGIVSLMAGILLCIIHQSSCCHQTCCMQRFYGQTMGQSFG